MSGTGVCKAEFAGALMSAIELGDADVSLETMGFDMCADFSVDKDVDPNGA